MKPRAGPDPARVLRRRPRSPPTGPERRPGRAPRRPKLTHRLRGPESRRTKGRRAKDRGPIRMSFLLTLAAGPSALWPSALWLSALLNFALLPAALLILATLLPGAPVRLH